MKTDHLRISEIHDWGNDMKLWRYYLLRVWRWSRVPLIVFILLYLGLLYMQARNDSACLHEYHTISSNGGNFDAQVDDMSCEGFGGFEVVIVRLVSKAIWPVRDATVFVFNPTDAYLPRGAHWTHDPVVTWLSPNELQIAVDRVGQIRNQVTEARGIKIIYRIGRVDYPK